MLIGADGEIFFMDGNKPAMAIGYVGGTKKEPRPLGLGFVQEDNVAAEFNIPPASAEDEWVHYLSSMVGEVRNIAASNNFEISFDGVAHFTREELMSEPMAMVLGCEPEMCVYPDRAKGRPSSRTTLRTIGTHIHVGCEIAQREPRKVVRAMDKTLAVAAMHLDPNWSERTSMYGGFGAYRIKPYGVEYRALSSFWLKSEELMRWAWRNTVKAVQNIDELAAMPLSEAILNYRDLSEDIPNAA